MNRDQIEGQLLATQAAIRGLINAHPDPRAALHAVQREIECAISVALPKDLPDAFVDGIQTAKGMLLPSSGDQARWPNRGQ